jgi:hypothetical protein
MSPDKMKKKIRYFQHIIVQGKLIPKGRNKGIERMEGIKTQHGKHLIL